MHSESQPIYAVSTIRADNETPRQLQTANRILPDFTKSNSVESVSVDGYSAEEHDAVMNIIVVSVRADNQVFP